MDAREAVLHETCSTFVEWAGAQVSDPLPLQDAFYERVFPRDR